MNDANINIAIDKMIEEISFGSNMRASKEYRTQMSKVLVKRAIMEVI
ncbi:MAG: hypothetical protein ACRDB0_05665 [Paraclostridium sp.]